MKLRERRNLLEKNILYDYVVLPSANRALETSKKPADVARAALRSAMEMHGVSLGNAIELAGRAAATVCVREQLKDLPPGGLKRDAQRMRSIAASALKSLGMKDDDVERVSTQVVAEIASRRHVKESKRITRFLSQSCKGCSDCDGFEINRGVAHGRSCSHSSGTRHDTLGSGQDGNVRD